MCLHQCSPRNSQLILHHPCDWMSSLSSKNVPSHGLFLETSLHVRRRLKTMTSCCLWGSKGPLADKWYLNELLWREAWTHCGQQITSCACVLCCFSRVWLCDHMDCSPPGSFVHGIFLARILEWVAMPSSRGSSRPRDQNHSSFVSCIGRQVLYHWCHLGSPYPYHGLVTWNYTYPLHRRRLLNSQQKYQEHLMKKMDNISEVCTPHFPSASSTLSRCLGTLLGCILRGGA